ncbi:MAG: carboxypeptidase regulatory-like domain-containing protein, partial [Chloroflexota bacterium]|nr:carboxypeptidase regulatory-like domain-containing protein [Chloroflexota bacterium]
MKKLILVTMTVTVLTLTSVLTVGAVAPDDPTTGVEVTDAGLTVGGIAASDIVVSIANEEGSSAELLGAEIHLQFDPAVVQVVDFDGDPGNGTQLEVRTDLFDGDVQIGANAADNVAGTIVFAITQLGGTGTPLLNASGPIATIHWMGVAEGGSAVTILEDTKLSDPDGYEIAVDNVSDGAVTVSPEVNPAWINGSVRLQGRYDFSGVTVTAVMGEAAYTGETSSEGAFSIEVAEPGNYNVVVSIHGYLDAQMADVVATEGEITDIGETTLLGGDVTGDNLIDIMDVAYIAFLATRGRPRSRRFWRSCVSPTLAPRCSVWRLGW